MDLQWRNDDEPEAMCMEDEDCNIDSLFEQERCGICIDIVIERGVLDCCDHWFCFACIDNWAAITNLCPICKTEFQRITCLLVYDPIKRFRFEEHSFSRNDDWSFQGKNNTLSFPSYYISEDAVKCLGNDGCKIQRGMQPTEDDLSFDTSIACDSCDTWYHAFCVGFNPEFTSENSWLCPRCINNKVPRNSDADSLQSFLKYSTPQTAEVGWIIDPSLSGKVSVSVADAGETAVIVSMIEGKQKTDYETPFFDRLDSNMDIEIAKSSLLCSDIENSVTYLQPKDEICIEVSQNRLVYSDYKEDHASASDVDGSSEIIFDISPEIIDFHPYGDLKESTVSSFSHDDSVNKPRIGITESQLPPPSQDAPFSLHYSEANGKEKNINALETSNSVYSDVYMDSSSVAHGTSEVKDEPGNNSNNIIVTSLAVPSLSSGPFSADKIVRSCNRDMVVDICQKKIEGCNLAAKPKMTKICTMDENNDHIRKRVPEAVFPVKKLKLYRKSKTLPTGNLSALPSLDCSQVCSRKYRDASLLNAKQEEAEASDIMSIVLESDITYHDMPTEMKAAKKSMDNKDSTCRLRMKKIMRRVGEKRESSIFVQELGKEIREVAQQKILEGIRKNDFDEKLLAAFRAAIVRPQTKPINRSDPVVGAKKPLLAKGKKRENLTKKIYGTASGRRRHAWARELEIEFWRHRCRRTQSDKVATLQSVLELLKKATNPHWNSSMERDSQEEIEDSILSRVYVADASLFPRKYDIKPLSALSGSAQSDDHFLNNDKISTNVVEQPFNDHKNSTKIQNQNSKSSLQLKANSCGSVGKLMNSPCLEEAPNKKANSCKAPTESVRNAVSGSSKEFIDTSKEYICPFDAKIDKRKWALEVLARKTASTNLCGNKGHEDGGLLKGKHPLLEQLPHDMRPVLESSRHNKVSSSVRQAQLYRITEHYLRKTNLPIIRRTAEIELAIADAINVEKQIFERSNSKLVYVNLCSQAVSQLANKSESVETNISDSLKIANEITDGTNYNIETEDKTESAETIVSSSTLPVSEVSNEVLGERIFEPEVGGWNNVEEALKMAGLFSDSPLSSPYCATNDLNEDESTHENVYDGSQINVIHAINTEMDATLTHNTGQAVMVNDCMKLEFKKLEFSNPLVLQKESRPENSHAENKRENFLQQNILEKEYFNEPLDECVGCNVKPLVSQISDKAVLVLKKPLVTEEDKDPISVLKDCILDDEIRVPVSETVSCISESNGGGSAQFEGTSAGKENMETHSKENAPIFYDKNSNEDIAELADDKFDLSISISKKVEAYIKEHIRPLCKSNVITADQYRWAVRKTLAKVMKFHHKAKNANFLIREGEKVKKLAVQYVEAAQQKELN